jgi:hypothetical protein
MEARVLGEMPEVPGLDTLMPVATVAVVPLAAFQRVLAGGLGALFGLMLLTGGILVGLATSRWPGR